MTLNKAPLSLPQLQNLIKRDPVSYKDEFQQQYRHYLSNLELFRLKPNRYNETFEELVRFIAQVSHCYPDVVEEFPNHLKSLLSDHSTLIDQKMRMAFCRSLMMLRKKNIVDIVDLFQVFFRLLKCQDKQLRKTLLIYFITDVKNANANRRNNQVNTALQSFMYKMLEDNHAIVMKTAVDVMVSLYNKNIWNDARTVNAIAQACFSKITKVVATALRFFCGKDEGAPASSESESEEEQTAKQVLFGMRVAKKTKRRQQRVDRAMRKIKRGKNKKKQVAFNFSALHLIHDPQGFAEKLFRQLEKSTDGFEVKVLLMNFVSRLIGIHQLILLNFYPFLLRFLQPHQRDVTKILQYAAQAAHEMVPPESIEPLLKTLANNFITDRNAGEVMAVGLNAAREICSRCPLAMPEDLLSDLVLYKNHRDKSVKLAAHSLILLFRDVNPEMLHKKFRGKPGAETEPRKALTFGESDAKNYIPGADILPDEEAAAASGDKPDDEKWESCSDEDDDSSGEWIDISHSDEEAEKDGTLQPNANVNPEERREKAAQVSQMRIFTQEDLKKLKQFEIQKQIGATTSKGKRKSVEVSFDDDEDEAKISGLVSLKSIEMVHKKRRHDKESRLATVMAGREGREEFNKKPKKKCDGASLSNKEKRKFKSFMMIKHKVQLKHKRSFRDKQIALRDALVKQKKMKH